MATGNPRNRVIAIAIVVIAVAVLGWAATQWGPFASKTAGNHQAGQSAAGTAASGGTASGTSTAASPKTGAETANAATCNVVLRGMRAEIVGHPDAVVFTAMGPAVQFLSANSTDKSAKFKLTPIKIDGGKAISIDKPSGKFDLVVQAKSMTPVQLAAKAKCGGDK